jgi:hypothetical protein
MIGHPKLSDLYVLPPIRYPDGRTYLKFGANTMIDRWLPDPAAVRAWYDHGDDDGPLPALREALTDLLPAVRIRFWHTRRCADAYTAIATPTSTCSNLGASSSPWVATAVVPRPPTPSAI